MTKFRDFEPGDPFPAWTPDALQDFLSGAQLNFNVRIKPGDSSKIQVPADADDQAAAVSIAGRWRYVTATVERAGSGSARTVDVHVTASADAFSTDSGPPVSEVDDTDRAFALAVTNVGDTPSSVDLSRVVARAVWDGAAFTSIVPFEGGVALDEVATTSDLVATAGVLSAAIADEATARAAADANNPSAGQKAALAGTSGTPGSGNKYVTDGDSRNSDQRTPSNLSVTTGKIAANAVTDGKMASPNNDAWRTLLTVAGWDNGFTAGSWFFGRDDTLSFPFIPIGGATSSNLRLVHMIRINPSDYDVANKFTKIRIAANAYTGMDITGRTYTFGLYKMGVPGSGGGALMSFTSGGPLSGTTVTLTVAGGEVVYNEAGDTDIGTDGLYAVGVVVAGGPVTNQRVALNAQIQVRNLDA